MTVMIPAAETNNSTQRPKTRLGWFWDVVLIVILLAGAYLRTVGMNWDGNQHLHPDERFLTMVESAMTPVKDLAQYFNTDASTLNPHNIGYSYYVYGTLPIFIVRYVAEGLGQTGYDQVNIVGRYTSAFLDWSTILLVYFTAKRLFKNRQVGILAAAFSAFSVLPIQLSHFFAVDTFVNFFSFLAFYFAVRVMTPGDKQLQQLSTDFFNHPKAEEDWKTTLNLGWSSLGNYIGFGAALGMAAASKISAAPVAILLPAAAVILYFRMAPENRKAAAVIFFRNLVIAAGVALIMFRICQPYAFRGPGFFDIMPNQKWIANLQELSQQSTGDVDFPPALQWARRPLTFAWTNMVEWGLGLPLGILAWAGFLWMAWRIIKGEWKQYALLWLWTGGYFAWQSLNWTRSMRYQLLIYPTLAMIAAWFIADLAKRTWNHRPDHHHNLKWVSYGVIGAGVLIACATAGWAYAFTRIYTQPVTRVEASRWIYQNVPGPINLQIDTGSSAVNQPLGFRMGAQLTNSEPIRYAFTPRKSGLLKEVDFTYIIDPQMNPAMKNLSVTIEEASSPGNILAVGVLPGDFTAASDPRGQAYQVEIQTPITLDPAKQYILTLQLAEQDQTLNFAGPIIMRIGDDQQTIDQSLPQPVAAIRSGQGFQTNFTPQADGTLSKVFVDHIVDWTGATESKTLQLSIFVAGPDQTQSYTTTVTSPFGVSKDIRGDGYTFEFNTPIKMSKDLNYILKLDLVEGSGAIGVYGSMPADETDWDDVVPLNMDGYSANDYSMGVYRTELNFQMYWDDNEAKRERFITNLDQADYIFITSNRQWGTTVRVPERYPMTTMYYRDLIGCPDNKDIIWCYSVADVGSFKGKLGFDLVYISQHEPTLGPLTFNTQFAEEAFTVYDHPKVLIFKKNANYNPDAVRQLFESLDLSTVVHITPRKADSNPLTLMLNPDQWARQQLGGTWAELYNINSLLNQYPLVGLIVWYLVISILGWLVYPLVRLAFGSLPDKGYPVSKLVGMLLLAYLVWMAGSAGIAFSRLTISIAFILIVVICMALAVWQWPGLKEEWKTKKRYFLTVELVGLAFFAISALIRFGNSDLWHPSKGGEKPMDFSYFNAVLKSTTFPPYDPWFAGGYLNYYYYGFVIVGVPVKWLGIVPSIAYNLILPTLFSLVSLGAFCMGWNIFTLTAPLIKKQEVDGEPVAQSKLSAWMAGLATSIGLLVLGNLGTVRMIWQGFQKLAAPDGNIDNANFFMRIVWTFQGLASFFHGNNLPYPPGDWYWIPSRAFPGEPITEFPMFTFLYADLHAHMISLPITILCLVWILSVVLRRWDWGDERSRWKSWLRIGACFLLGGLAIGALRPTNTWDWPTYMVFGSLAITYSILRSEKTPLNWWPNINPVIRRLLTALVVVVALIFLMSEMYAPFSRWFDQGYNAVDPWTGSHSPFWSYFTHWGLFLFVILSWLIWEARDWMANTPLTALRALIPYKGYLQILVALFGALVIALLFMGVSIAWLALPMAVLALILMLRPGQAEAKRLVLFMIGTALVLTLAVEVIVLRGDIGRMNTVFKFYMQAWTLLSISAVACLFWLLPNLAAWRPNWRKGWKICLAVLVGSAALFPLMASFDKVTDRMAPTAPHTLDGMTYMASAHYSDFGADMDLSQDYRAIQWMQQNVQGSPVIVEANTPEYRWGSRFTIYTGLPGVVGWNWHQRQQRGVVSADQVTNRIDEVNSFYLETNAQTAFAFLQKYNVRYIIVGQLERAEYPGTGLDKFEQYNGQLWHEVYRDGQTVIYAVNASN